MRRFTPRPGRSGCIINRSGDGKDVSTLSQLELKCNHDFDKDKGRSLVLDQFGSSRCPLSFDSKKSALTFMFCGEESDTESSACG